MASLSVWDDFGLDDEMGLDTIKRKPRTGGKGRGSRRGASGRENKVPAVTSRAKAAVKSAVKSGSRRAVAKAKSSKAKPSKPKPAARSARRKRGSSDSSDNDSDSDFALSGSSDGDGAGRQPAESDSSSDDWTKRPVPAAAAAPKHKRVATAALRGSVLTFGARRATAASLAAKTRRRPTTATGGRSALQLVLGARKAKRGTAAARMYGKRSVGTAQRRGMSTMRLVGRTRSFLGARGSTTSATTAAHTPATPPPAPAVAAKAPSPASVAPSPASVAPSHDTPVEAPAPVAPHATPAAPSPAPSADGCGDVRGAAPGTSPAASVDSLTQRLAAAAISEGTPGSAAPSRGDPRGTPGNPSPVAWSQSPAKPPRQRTSRQSSVSGGSACRSATSGVSGASASSGAMSLPSPVSRHSQGSFGGSGFDSRATGSASGSAALAAAAAARALSSSTLDSPASVYSASSATSGLSRLSSSTAGSGAAPGVGLCAGWGQAEHMRLVRAMQLFGIRRGRRGKVVAGGGKWKRVQLEVGTKTLAQCRTYAQLILTGDLVIDGDKAAAAPVRDQAVPATTAKAVPAGAVPQASVTQGVAAGTIAASNTPVAARPSPGTTAAMPPPLPAAAAAAKKGRGGMLKWSVAQTIQQQARSQRRQRLALQRRRVRHKQQETSNLRMLRRLSMLPVQGWRRHSSIMPSSTLSLDAGAGTTSRTSSSATPLSPVPDTDTDTSVPLAPVSEEGSDSRVADAPASATTSTDTAAGRAAAHWARMQEALPLVLEWVADEELLGAAHCVSRQWARVSTTVYSWRAAGTSASTGLASGAGAGAGGGAGAGAGAGAGSDSDGDDDDMPTAKVLHAWKSFHAAFPWAAFLAEGAYKQVYQVWCAAQRRLEAVSVTDVEGVAVAGNMPIIRAEVHCGCILSELVRTNVCPHFVEIYQVFNYAYSPATHLKWGDEGNPNPMGDLPGHLLLTTAAGGEAATDGACSGTGGRTRRRASRRGARSGARKALPRRPAVSRRGVYQFVRAELCRGGDAEEYLRRLAANVSATPGSGAGAPAATDALTVPRVQRLLFQMVWSLHVAQQRVSLRHYDVKLLNVLLQSPRSLQLHDADSGTVQRVVMRYRCPTSGRLFRVPLEAGVCSPRGALELDGVDPVVKWADFGTADTDASSLGAPVGVEHYTTLENTAPELWLLGDAAVQSYAIDSFALGLAALHLCTGHMPYEELLADVQCPPELARLLLLAWQGKATADVLQAAATTGATSTKPAKRSTRATRARTRGARGAAKSRGGTGNSSGASPDADCAPGGVTLPLRCTYSALTQVLDTDDSVRIMQDTVYRVLVLFGLPGQAGVDARSMATAQLPAWWRDSGSAACAVIGTALVGATAPCADAFAADRARFSFEHGSNPVIAAARARLHAAGDAGQGIAVVVRDMCSLHCDGRPALEAVLASPAFSDFAAGVGTASTTSCSASPRAGDVELQFDP